MYILSCSILSSVTVIIPSPHYYFVSSSVFTHEIETDVSYFIYAQHVNWIFFPSFLERGEPERCCLECQGRVCHKDIIALENGHLLPFKKKTKKKRE